MSGFKGFMLDILAHGFEVYQVGGSVRDTLLGRPVDDYDLTTNASYSDLLKIFSDRGLRLNEDGKYFHVLKVEDVDIASFRKDVYYKGVSVPLPEVASTLKEDSERRDFTINALAYDIDGSIVDYHGGLEDLANKVIRTIGSPVERFTQDPYRMVRAVELASRLDFKLADEITKAIKDLKDLITPKLLYPKLSDLFSKVFHHRSLSRFLTLLKETDLLEKVIPVLFPLVGLKQNPKYHCYDVFDHTVEVVKNIEQARSESASRDKALLYASMLHDVGKGVTAVQGVNKAGEPTFIGHEQAGVSLAEAYLLEWVGECKSVTASVKFLVKWHGLDLTKSKRSKYIKYLKEMAKDCVSSEDLEMKLQLLLSLVIADINAFEPSFRNEVIVERKAMLADLLHYRKEVYLFRKDLPIDGSDLMALGFSGKQISEVLDSLIGSESCSKQEMLDFVVKNYKLKQG